MKHRPSLILLILLTFIAFVATTLVYGQGGSGPQGKRLVNHYNEVLVLPNGYDYTYTSAKDGTVVCDGAGGLYFYVAANGKWSKVTATTPTPTATASSTSTPTPTPTP